MSKRSIETHFWNDSYIGELEPDLKMLFLYLISCPLSNMLGVYEIQIRRIAFDTGLSFERVKEGLERFRSDKKADYVDGYVLLANFVKNQSYNTNMLKSALNEIEEIPDSVLSSPIFLIIAQSLVRVNEGLGKGSVTLPNRVISKIESESEVEEESEKENEGESEMGAPASEEIPGPSKIAARRKDLHPDADIPDKGVWTEHLLASLRYSKEFVEHLWDHLQVKGWSVGDPPMPVKDWKAYARKQSQWAYEYDQKQKNLESNTQNNGNNRKQKGRGNDASGFLHHLAGKGSS